MCARRWILATGRAAWCLLFLVAGFAVATQLFALNLVYHPSLGPNVRHIYPPWEILRWAQLWYGRNSNLFTFPAAAGVATTSAGPLLAVIGSFSRSRSLTASPYLHGSARWASKKDIERPGLLNNGPQAKKRLQKITIS
jgi:type IV secretion system protein VirD4